MKPRVNLSTRALSLLLFTCCGPAALAGPSVSSHEARSPADELRSLRVPEGFEVQLVASEPDINKPINIAFDDRGRLWVTCTVEYPFPAAENAKTRDTVKILEDFGTDGRAKKITTFAENLNIPVGVLPRGDNSALVYSIPNIWKVTDPTGSGHADKKELILGSIGRQDTHGMTGSFNEGFDGWVYAVHGFLNTSTLTASDGSSITLNSGNTYRFKPDGSHVEQWTHGQVNPFGMTFDPHGNLFTSDCETMPIALMMREGYHPSFGKPDDGLGFAPEMCDHMYGATAIAGLCEYVADQYPSEYHGRMFVGNVVESLVKAAQITPRGSGFHADDEPNFLSTPDEWFRPVCMKLGPDGALYIADFYNRIIGHYEVDLHHPGRDKERGRIWRVVYTGKGVTPPAKFDLTQLSPAQVVDELANTNLTIRMLAMNRLADTIGQPAIAPLKEAIAKPKNAAQKAHALWALLRLGALEPSELTAAAGDADPLVREHALRIIGESTDWKRDERQLALAGLKDADLMTRRLAVEALARHPNFEDIRPLLDLREQKNDPDLTYGLRLALRDELQPHGVCDRLSSLSLNLTDKQALADVAVAASGSETAGFLLDYVKTAQLDRPTLTRYLRTIAKFVPQQQADALAKFIVEKFADDPDVQIASLKSVLDGLSQRGATPGPAVKQWGLDLAQGVLGKAGGKAAAWTYRPIDPSHDTRNPWAAQIRKSADGDAESLFLSSNVFGETLTGSVRSPEFKIPATLTFYLAGHNGPLGKAPVVKNVVRLRDAKTGEILAEQVPPRNDSAQKITWQLSSHAGQQGYFEATDGDSAAAWAWMAFGRFDPPVVHISDATLHLAMIVGVVESLHLDALAGPVEHVLTDPDMDADSRMAAAHALSAMDAKAHVAALATVVRDAKSPPEIRHAAADALGPIGSPESSAALLEAIVTAPQKLQLDLAKALASTNAGAEALFGAIQGGKASAQLLQDNSLKERLNVSKPANLDARIAELTKGLGSPDREIQKLIDHRAGKFDPATASAARGLVVFQKNCMACHMVGGKGAHVGPQLDGIGIRGVPRLCEDVLDPSRNVDVAFRYSTFVLNDGNVVDGIPRREEGQTITLADATGKEVAIDKANIKRRVESKLSLMPSNFGEIIAEQDFDDLMGYLLSTAQK